MTSYQPSFFDESERFQKLDKLEDPLSELSRHIDFEAFRAKLEEALPRGPGQGRQRQSSLRSLRRELGGQGADHSRGNYGGREFRGGSQAA
ncbi:hypothetical protein MLD52_20950 [Puniceicoccaceae bacterium K14]|nr:hypothetical protein [Puniceicoccaceae bacterium K14]